MRRFRAPAATIWPWLTEPELLSRWGARVVGTATGADGTYACAGATRTVYIPAGPFTIAAQEQVVAASPPVHLVYRVVRGGGLRHHQGTLSLRDLADGSELSWTVELATWVPGASSLVRAVVRPQLEQGLAALARRLEMTPPEAPTEAQEVQGPDLQLRA